MFLVTLLYFSLSHRPGFSTNPAPGVGRLSIGCCILFKTVPPSEPHTRYVAPRYQNCATGADSSECKVYFYALFYFFYFLYSYFLQKYAKLWAPCWLYCCLQQLSIFTPYCVHDGHEYVLVLRGVVVYGVSSAVWHTKAAGLRD